MRTRSTRFGIRAAVATAVFATAGAAAAAGVVLPSHASDKARSSTSGVSLPTQSQQGSANLGASGDSSNAPNDHAAFGQCVAGQAKTASDNGGKGWQPVVACASLKPSANASNSSTGLDAAAAHANDHASTGLTTAGNGASNGYGHANANGASHIPPH